MPFNCFFDASPNEVCVAMAKGLAESIFQIGYPAPMCEGNWSRSSCKPFATLHQKQFLHIKWQQHAFAQWIGLRVSSPKAITSKPVSMSLPIFLMYLFA